MAVLFIVCVMLLVYSIAFNNILLAMSSKIKIESQERVDNIQVPEVIPESTPLELWIAPHRGDYELRTPVYPTTKDCSKELNPSFDRKDPASYGVFFCGEPFGLPGTNTQKRVVMMGHSSWHIPFTLNFLSQLPENGKELVGEDIYVKTAASGEFWLVYQITSHYVVGKQDATDNYAIWGEENNTAGRLILVTCYLNPDDPKNTNSTKNIFLVAQFREVKAAQ